MSTPDALPPPILAAQNLTVSRGGRMLFSGLNLAVPAGGVLVLRGPNGAGKTSLLLALAGVLRPDDGSVTFRDRGETLEREAFIHLLLVQNAVKPRLTVGENLGFWREVYGATGIAAGAALERVGLGGLGVIEAGHLSTGQTRRLALARLLVSRRLIWLLDEPATALDAAGEALVREMIVDHCGGGGIAVAATHHDLGLGSAQSVTISDGAAVFGVRP
jgi:heme exporter protein A